MRNLALLASLLLSACGGSDAQVRVVELEHGYRTDRVVATRYKNTMMGYNVGFDLPKNCYDADRADMYEWLSTKGVYIFQGGGAPCATNFAQIRGVTDRESANEFLLRFLPEFDAWVRANLH
jgi:hypothetical protein